MKKALIILAGGEGKRFNKSSIPKQFIRINSYNIIEYFLTNLEKDLFNTIKIVVNPNMKKKYLSNLKKNFKFHNIQFVKAGNNRQQSSRNGIIALKREKPKIVLIHDAARPLASNTLIKKLIKKIKTFPASSPYIKTNDLIKDTINKKNFLSKNFIHIQTPQAFSYKHILKAHQKTNIKNSKDDTELIDDIGIKINFIKGEKSNIKITYIDDLKLFNLLKKKNFKHGIGYDIHKIDFKSKKKLKLCGVTINHNPLVGHLDADVGYHEICDSILGSLSLRDIGFYFKTNDKRWKNIDSLHFVKFCKRQLDEKNYKISNIDINFICETPNINKYVKKMKKNISKALKIKDNIISIKATTNEKVSFIGQGKAIAAESVVQIKND